MTKYTGRASYSKHCISIVLLSLCILLCSCSTDSKTEVDSNSHRLLITLSDSNPATSSLTISNLDFSKSISINFHQIPDLFIEIDGEITSLKDAIQKETISVEEIIAYAQIDARNRKCLELYESTNGLSRFIYRYSEYDLIYVHDIYETPDGNEHLVYNLTFCQSGQHSAINTHYYNEDGIYLIDREDWGIVFTIEESNSKNLTINCIQKGGQHLGNLVATEYSIYSKETDEWIISSSLYTPNVHYGDVFINNNDSTLLTIDWSNIPKELPTGRYTLILTIKDIYDQSNVHPLMKNFHDYQNYYIDFSIK